MHIWIIMDWNRRWAKKRLLPTLAWHKAWFDNAMDIVEKANDKWIKYLTLWALSKENLVKREKEELSWIIKLIDKLNDLIPRFQKNNLNFQTIWDIEKLPLESQKILEKVKNETKNNTWLTLIVALVYSWEDEIIRAVKKFINSIPPWERGLGGFNSLENLNEEWFRQYLDTANFPKPDLIIRTGWDIRHSWFLLYDSDYSEYYFSEKLWPDFDENELDKALNFLNKSKRNFGK